MIRCFKQLLCTHTEDREFIRNIYGDEIISCGYKRSIWRCVQCDKVIYASDLHTEDEQRAAQAQKGKA